MSLLFMHVNCINRADGLGGGGEGIKKFNDILFVRNGYVETLNFARARGDPANLSILACRQGEWEIRIVALQIHRP
jgi:hypothetical protein